MTTIASREERRIGPAEKKLLIYWRMGGLDLFYFFAQNHARVFPHHYVDTEIRALLMTIGAYGRILGA